MGNIISEKEFGGSLRLKFRSLCLKITKTTQALRQEKRVSLIYWERVSGEMHLRVLVETQQVRKMDLNWIYLFCSYGNGMVRLPTGPISGSLFRTIRILNLFWMGSLGLFLYNCVNVTSLLPAFWNGPERTNINSHLWLCEGGLLYKICIWPIE